MAGPYKTPGVYVEEISKFPPSVAQVETAIPAFIGYTEKVVIDGIAQAPNTLTPVRIGSMVEYEEMFGGPFQQAFSIEIENKNEGDTAKLADWGIKTAPAKPALVYRMYYALQMYFANGGGPCYIVSVDTYDVASPAIDPKRLMSGDPAAATPYSGGLAALEKEDEPTMILFPDALSIPAADDFYAVYQQALQQCGKLMDRVTLCDVFDEDVDLFRDKIGTHSLSYAAAYHPHLKTILTFAHDESAVEITVSGTDTLFLDKDGAPVDPAVTRVLKDEASPAASLFHQQNGLYHSVKSAIARYKIVLAPSSAIAGVYANVDSTRGVWKAPANVSLSAVIEPTLAISHEEQEGLNVHTSGKSINAIRSFIGKGVLVWGARTLAGNDNEWRYISVRRFFNMVEESVKKALEPFVFEPNDANTWVRVRAMIENFLVLQWRAGALAGAKPEDAFYVRVGLGETMTPQDILEGRMIVEIGMAAVRPAEFIILQFSHKMQES